MFRNSFILGMITVFCASTQVSAQTSSPLDLAAGTASASKEGKFTGSPITLKLKDADVHEVLRLIGETSGFNIVIHPLVQGKITVSLEQVPWDQALDVVLTTLKLGAERNESVLRILPRELLLAEKQQDLDSKKLSLATAPRITRIFPVSYADLSQLSQILQNFANSQNNTGGASAGGAQIPPATIIIDNNTESLIVRDTAENVEKIRKLISLLDVQTPQVLIEAKVIEVTEAFSKDFGGSLGVGGTQLGVGFNGPQSLLGTAIALPATSGPAAGAISGTTIMNLGNRLVGLNASLRMAESENKVKVISSPRTVILSGKTAAITQAQTTAKTLVTPGTSTSPATSQIVQVTANTKLNVTPRVTNDGSVFMKLDLSRDVLHFEADGTPSTQPRQMNTEVIVESGNTLVIGGVLSVDENLAEGGMPFLRKIPILGALFGSETDQKTKSELMFFVTPRILNQKKTALSDDDMKKL